MSFLGGIGAGKEGAYFYRESKQAVTRLVDKSPSASGDEHPSSPSDNSDVLPEVLRHSLPLRAEATSSPTYSASKWSLRVDPTNSSASSSRLSINPLTSNLSLPQVPLGSKSFIWTVPPPTESLLASTANELRKDRRDVRLNPEKLKAATEGLSLLGKAFVVATAIVFGGGVVAFRLAASKLEISTNDDIRTKGKDAIEPRFEKIRERLAPIKAWAEDASKRWRLDEKKNVNEKSLSKELSKVFARGTSN